MKARSRAVRGQIVVEVLLVLPIFLWLLFSIMEIGHLAFRSILLHHAAYEVARYGSLTCFDTFMPEARCPAPRENKPYMDKIATQILPGASLSVEIKETLQDNQEECMSHDIVATLTQKVPMIFPMTGLLLATDKRSNTRKIKAAVPMPVEQPLFGRRSS